jgi:hypothetical protein
MKKQFRRWPVVLLVFAMLSLSATPTRAGGDELFDPIDAQKLIDACWAISEEELASISNSEMRKGLSMTVGCFHEVIIEQSKAFFEPEYLEEAQIKKHLHQLEEGYKGVYWWFYNGHKGCRIIGLSCGTMHHQIPSRYYTRILEEIIRDIASQRNRYHL